MSSLVLYKGIFNKVFKTVLLFIKGKLVVERKTPRELGMKLRSSGSSSPKFRPNKAIAFIGMMPLVYRDIKLIPSPV